MNANSRPGLSPKPPKHNDRNRKTGRLWATLIGIVLLGCVILGWVLRQTSSSSVSQTPLHDPADISAAAASKEGEDSRLSTSPFKRHNSSAASTRTKEVITPAPTVEPAVLAIQLISKLSQMDLSQGTLTPEQAKQINESLKDLVALGTAAVPSIREFLARNADLSYGDQKGGKMIDYSSLRIGLFDALKQIGGPEALEVSLSTLQNTGDPWEVAILARNVEQQAPGEYRQDVLKAARESLAQASPDRLAGRDVAPLFQIFQTYGDASVVADLEKHIPQWGYYAIMTLAALPDGEGIPALLRQAQDPSAVGTRRGDLALQMLAQVSVDRPEAAAALVLKARLNQIPDTAWRALGSSLAGAQFEMGTPLVDNPYARPVNPGVQKYHIEEGNQTLYRIPFSPSLFEEQVQQRIDLIDQLLAANSNPAAREPLQNARAQLAGISAKANDFP